MKFCFRYYNFASLLQCFLFPLNIKNHTAWKISKCKVFSGPYFPVFGPEKFGNFSGSVIVLLIIYLNIRFLLTFKLKTSAAGEWDIFTQEALSWLWTKMNQLPLICTAKQLSILVYYSFRVGPGGARKSKWRKVWTKMIKASEQKLKSLIRIERYGKAVEAY